MNQKQIGYILIILSLISIFTTWQTREKENRYISHYIKEQGSCFLDDGTCLHDDRDNTFYIMGLVVSCTLMVFGVYLSFIDKTQQFLAEHQVKVSSALESAKKQEKEKDEFRAYLAGFDEKEQLVLKAIREQDGIQQSTLRFRTSTSKATLSHMLKSLEGRNIISRKPQGKTNKVFLVKKF